MLLKKLYLFFLIMLILLIGGCRNNNQNNNNNNNDLSDINLTISTSQSEYYVKDNIIVDIEINI